MRFSSVLSRSRSGPRHYYDGTRQENVTMSDGDWLTQQFEQSRERLRAIAYRMLGSQSEADDAVQEA